MNYYFFLCCDKIKKYESKGTHVQVIIQIRTQQISLLQMCKNVDEHIMLLI